MANSLTSLDRGRPSSLARHRQGSPLLSNARQGIAPSFAVVTYKGRNFRIKYRTEEHIIRDDRGRASTYIDTVIVGVSPNISRQYFPDAYVEGASEGPACYSTDGKVPDVGVPHRQNPVCSTCKWSQWGSRVTDGGKRAKACQETRRLAVVPLANIENELMGGPMMLRVPPMSLTNLSNYSDFLASKGASFETVATRIGFDENVAYPRLTFETLDWLDDDQQLQATGEHGDGGMCASPMIERMLGATSDAPAEPQQAPPRQAPVEMPAEEDDDEVVEEEDDEEETPQVAVNPFAAEVNRAQGKPQPRGLDNLPVGQEAAAAAPRPRGRPRKEGNGKTAPAPLQIEVDMESALDSLLGDSKSL
jgi:hypothetical protein